MLTSTIKRQRVGMPAGATWAARAMLKCYHVCALLLRSLSRIGMQDEKDSVSWVSLVVCRC